MDRDDMILMRSGLTEKAIADVLRSERADQSFLNALAMMLDPAPGKQPTYRLKLKYFRDNRPKGKKFDEAALVADLRELAAGGLSRGEVKRERQLIELKHDVDPKTAREAIKRADADDQLWNLLEALDKKLRE